MGPILRLKMDFYLGIQALFSSVSKDVPKTFTICAWTFYKLWGSSWERLYIRSQLMDDKPLESRLQTISNGSFFDKKSALGKKCLPLYSGKTCELGLQIPPKKVSIPLKWSPRGVETKPMEVMRRREDVTRLWRCWRRCSRVVDRPTTCYMVRRWHGWERKGTWAENHGFLEEFWVTEIFWPNIRHKGDPQKNTMRDSVFFFFNMFFLFW